MGEYWVWGFHAPHQYSFQGVRTYWERALAVSHTRRPLRTSPVHDWAETTETSWMRDAQRSMLAMSLATNKPWMAITTTF